jgi:hypothetical protein
MRTLRAAPVLVVMLLLATPVGHGGEAASLSPLVIDWARYLSIQSQTASGGRGTVVYGTVHNTSDWSLRRIQLLVESLDAGGVATDQRVVWLGSDLTPGSRAYFEVPASAATSHRVSVFAFEGGRRGN